MPQQQKIFISYSTKDHEIAASLYKDLNGAGANVFQFEKSATPGQAAMSEVLGRIEQSDIFMLLTSKNALKSKAVYKEVQFAYYQSINESTSLILLPLILEPDLRLFAEVRPNTNISFIDYEKGRDELFSFLKLKRTENVLPQTGSSLEIKSNPKKTDKAVKPPIQRRTGLKKTLSVPNITAPPLALRTKPFQTKLNLESRTIVLTKYVASIALVAVAAALLVWWLNGLIEENQKITALIENYSGKLNSWSLKWAWIPLTTKIIFGAITAVITYYVIDDFLPIDIWDYVIVTAKATGVALLVSLTWSFLFLQPPFCIASFIYINIGVATAAVIYYALFEDYLI